MHYDYEKVDEFMLEAEEVVKSRSTEEAFDELTFKIDNCEDRYLNDFIRCLNILQHEPVLDWIEKSVQRTNNISSNWGHLAASSKFSWERAVKWLDMGRPTSIVALDALIFCTTTDERLNQSLWMQQLKPKLINTPELDIVANKLQDYVKSDSVPRIKNSVNRIIKNIFATD